MEDIEQYQTRIFAALDKISRITSDSSSGTAARAAEDDGLRQRDLSLIEELEATLAEERLDLDAERDAVASLKGKLVEAERAADVVVSATDGHETALREIETALNDSETARKELAEKLQDAERAKRESSTAVTAAEAARQEAERQFLVQQREQDRRQNSTGHLEEQVERLNARIESQDVQFQRLKDANAQLRDSNALLRERNVEMLGDASVIDQSMRAELEALKTTRAADVDEMNTILDELKPLVEGQSNG